MNFDTALKFVLVREGPDSNDPDDPGGLTSRGITQSRYQAFCVEHQLPTKLVTTLTDLEVREFYRLAPWAKVAGDKLPYPVALVAFDAAVNQGEAYAPRLLQWAVNVAQDGVVGPKTLAAVADFWDPILLAERMVWARLTRYIATCRAWESKGKARPWKYIFGWTNRLTDLRQAAGIP